MCFLLFFFVVFQIYIFLFVNLSFECLSFVILCEISFLQLKKKRKNCFLYSFYVRCFVYAIGQIIVFS